MNTINESQKKLPSPNQPTKSHHFWKWFLLLILIVAGIAAYFLFSKKEDKSAKTNRAISVAAAVAKQGDLNIYLTGLGTVTALNTVTVHSRVDGQLDKVAFVEGQMIKSGDLLAEIDPRPFEVQLTQAEGQLAKDQASLKNAQLDLKRNQDAKEAVSKQQLDTAAATVDQFEGSVKTDQGQIDSAKLQLTYCRITAPITGRVGLRLVDQGNIIHSSDPTGLVVITQLQPISVVFTLPEDNIPQILKAQEANKELPVEAYDRDMKNRIATGTLLAVDNQIDSTTGTIRFKATFPNEKNELFPNQFVNVRLLVDVRHDAVLVPPAAIQRSPQSAFVYVVKPDNTIEMQTVIVGPTEGNQTLVEQGLSADETVVTDGVDKLQNGSAVAIRSEKSEGDKNQ